MADVHSRLPVFDINSEIVKIEVKDEIEIHDESTVLEWATAEATVTDECLPQAGIKDEIEVHEDALGHNYSPLRFPAVRAATDDGSAQERYFNHERNGDLKFDCDNLLKALSSGIILHHGEAEELETSARPTARRERVGKQFDCSCSESRSPGDESPECKYEGRCSKAVRATRSTTPADGRDVPAASEHPRATHLAAHGREEPVDSFTCDVCGKSCRKKYALVSHVRMHTDERPFGCALCGKTFRQKAALIVHLKHHAGDNEHKCEACGKVFKKKCQLSAHAIVHASERPFGCNMCFKAYKSKADLNVHFVTHTDETPFSCELCGKGFRYKTTLNRHAVVHMTQRPYSCSLCGKAFKTRGDINIHTVTHFLRGTL